MRTSRFTLRVKRTTCAKAFYLAATVRSKGRQRVQSGGRSVKRGMPPGRSTGSERGHVVDAAAPASGSRTGIGSENV